MGSQAMVNLRLVHMLLTAASDQPYGFLKVRGAELAREVELMAEAGLIEASPTIHDPETCAVINRVTNGGHSFLRAFQDDPPPTDSLEAQVPSLAEH